MSSLLNTFTNIKQQPISPMSFNSFPNEIFNNKNDHHHENDQLSPIPNNIAESSSQSIVIPSKVIEPEGEEDKRRCAVCNDVASGYHYGVWSCEGCKAFFKRSIQGTNEYICPATNTCTIDKHRRKSCQACRLRRCYEVGMTKGTTRRERKYRKKAVSVCKITSTSSNGKVLKTNPNIKNSEHDFNLLTSNRPMNLETCSESQTKNNHFSPMETQITKSTFNSTHIPNTTTEFLLILSQASRLNLPAKIDTTRSFDDRYFLQLLAKVFDQELVVLINWAKSMPGYTQNLTLDQQVTIIEQSWLDTLLLDILERSLERNDDILQFAPDFTISRHRGLSSPIVDLVCTYLFNILQAFKEPRTTHEEFIALKATIFVNSVPTSITSTKGFRKLTNQIYQVMQYACESNPNVYQDNYIRHFTLLLQLPHIKMLSSKLIRLFLDMRTNKLLPQADLLLEMLEAQDTLDISFHEIVNNISSRTESCNGNVLKSDNEVPLIPYSMNNSSIYSTQYSNVQSININNDNTTDFSGKSSPFIPSMPSFQPKPNDSFASNGIFF